MRPGNHVILHKVLDLYSETKQWKKAVEIIQQIADLEKDPIRRASTTTPRRASCATRSSRLDEAIDMFNLALDQYFATPEKITDAELPRST